MSKVADKILDRSGMVKFAVPKAVKVMRQMGAKKFNDAFAKAVGRMFKTQRSVKQRGLMDLYNRELAYDAARNAAAGASRIKVSPKGYDHIGDAFNTKREFLKRQRDRLDTLRVKPDGALPGLEGGHGLTARYGSKAVENILASDGDTPAAIRSALFSAAGLPSRDNLKYISIPNTQVKRKVVRRANDISKLIDDLADNPPAGATGSNPLYDPRKKLWKGVETSQLPGKNLFGGAVKKPGVTDKDPLFFSSNPAVSRRYAGGRVQDKKGWRGNGKIVGALQQFDYDKNNFKSVANPFASEPTWTDHQATISPLKLNVRARQLEAYRNKELGRQGLLDRLINKIVPDYERKSPYRDPLSTSDYYETVLKPRGNPRANKTYAVLDDSRVLEMTPRLRYAAESAVARNTPDRQLARIGGQLNKQLHDFYKNDVRYDDLDRGGYLGPTYRKLFAGKLDPDYTSSLFGVYPDFRDTVAQF